LLRHAATKDEPAISTWMWAPESESRTLTRVLPPAFVRAAFRMANDAPEGTVVISAGQPAEAPGRTRIDMSP
jgi:hypothetical protein